MIVSPDAWACQDPVNGSIPGTSAAALRRERQRGNRQSCQCNCFHFAHLDQNGLTVVSLAMNMPWPVSSWLKRMPSPPATIVHPWML